RPPRRTAPAARRLRPTCPARPSRRAPPSSCLDLQRGRARRLQPEFLEPLEPALETGFVREEDEQRVVAGERAFLLAHRLVDRLGDHARGTRRPGDEEDQPAPPDRDRDVREDPPEALVRRGPRWSGDVLRRDVEVAVAAGDLHDAELRDVPADRRLGHREPALDEPFRKLLLVADRVADDDLADRPLAVALRCRSRVHAAPTAFRTAVIRVPNVGSLSARSSARSAEASAMTASAPSQASAVSAARILGTMPPAMTPASMSVSASATVTLSSGWPAARV